MLVLRVYYNSRLPAVPSSCTRSHTFAACHWCACTCVSATVRPLSAFDVVGSASTTPIAIRNIAAARSADLMFTPSYATRGQVVCHATVLNDLSPCHASPRHAFAVSKMMPCRMSRSLTVNVSVPRASMMCPRITRPATMTGARPGSRPIT